MIICQLICSGHKFLVQWLQKMKLHQNTTTPLRLFCEVASNQTRHNQVKQIALVVVWRCISDNETAVVQIVSKWQENHIYSLILQWTVTKLLTTKLLASDSKVIFATWSCNELSQSYWSLHPKSSTFFFLKMF